MTHEVSDEPTPETPAAEAATPAIDAPSRPRFEDLPPAAQRALLEAEERRRARDAAAQPAPREIAGRGGAEPVRFGDWEVKGIACDF